VKTANYILRVRKICDQYHLMNPEVMIVKSRKIIEGMLGLYWKKGLKDILKDIKEKNAKGQNHWKEIENTQHRLKIGLKETVLH